MRWSRTATRLPTGSNYPTLLRRAGSLPEPSDPTTTWGGARLPASLRPGGDMSQYTGGAWNQGYGNKGAREPTGAPSAARESSRAGSTPPFGNADLPRGAFQKGMPQKAESRRGALAPLLRTISECSSGRAGRYCCTRCCCHTCCYRRPYPFSCRRCPRCG